MSTSALPRVALSIALLAVVASSGCTRAFYRRQADIDAYSLVREKANHPHWALPSYTISVDPRSRMYDPFAIDCPPIPPDDPTAHQLMHCVDNKRGWPFWHDNGERPTVENPVWPEYIEVDNRGVMSISATDAVRLALLHSRNYQQNLETLYLSALDVSFERFRFDSQFFAGYSLFGVFDGRARSGLAKQTGIGGNSSSQLTASTFSTSNPAGWQVRKLTTTGGTLIADFANALVWQFSGPDDYRGTSLVDFTLIQPLLRNAGRDRVLERLTRAERVLLANVRQMEQYRQGFYVDIMTGSGAGTGPSRAGGVFGGSGLEGFSGVGGGGFGNLTISGGGTGAAAAAAPGAAGGYLALLQSQREIRNQEDNVRALRRTVTRLTTLLEEQPAEQAGAYLSQGLQVAQARQQLLTAETNLLTQRNTYQSDLDTFKVTDLGLPPMVCIAPVDNLLDQFVLIDPTTIRLPEDWETILTSHPQARRDVPERIGANVETVTDAAGLAMCRLRRYPELEQDLQALRPALAEMQQFAAMIVNQQLPAIEQDVQKFRQALPRRKAWIARMVARIESLQNAPCEILPLGLNPLAGAGDGSYARDLAVGLDSTVNPELLRTDAELRPMIDRLRDLVAPRAIGNGQSARELVAQIKTKLAAEAAQPAVRELLARLESALNPETLGAGEIVRNLTWRLERTLSEVEDSLVNLGGNFRGYHASLENRAQLVEELIANPNQTPEQLFEKLVRGVYDPHYECGKTRVITFDVVEDISRELTELLLLQARARTESVELAEVDLAAERALEVARKYRRDWMNARASLVDSWRLVQFNSDQLQSQLDIIFSGDLGNITDNPFKLRSTTGRLRAGVQFDAPITRLSERNTYRQSLIEFQQARRNYYTFEDNVARTLRGQLRSVLTFQLNFELQRLAVNQAARQVILNTFIDREDQRALTTRVTAARDAVQAVNDLLNAQNQFMRVFVTYEVVRMSLDLNLGTMQLDQEGLWIDPVRIGADYGEHDPWLRQFNHNTGGDMWSDPEALPPTPGKQPAGAEPQFLPPLPPLPSAESLPPPPR